MRNKKKNKKEAHFQKTKNKSFGKIEAHCLRFKVNVLFSVPFRE